MPVPTDITAGTISISGSTVTGVGTSFEASDIRQGDLFIWIEGGAGQWSPIVQTVTSNTVLTLAEPWTGPTISGARYRLRYQWDSSRVSAQSRQLIEMLDNGNVLALSGLTGPGVPVFDGPHSMTLRPETDFINGVAYNVQVDTLDDRAAYDGQAAGYSVLVSDVGDGRSAVYSKASNTSGDWTDPAYITGPIGGTPDIAAGTTTTLPPGSDATFDVTPDGSGGYLLSPGIPAGRGFTNRGAYDSGEDYVVDDVVTFAGSTFIAIQAVPPGNPPSSAMPPVSNAYWAVLASRGANGAGTVSSVAAGSGIAVDPTDPTAPVVALATVPTATVKGRVAAGTGAPTDLTGTQVNTILPLFGTAKGLVPGRTSALGLFLRDDGTWQTAGGNTSDLEFTVAQIMMRLADIDNVAQFLGPNGNRFADSYDALTYVDVAGATNLDSSTSGVLKPTVFASGGTAVTTVPQTTTVNFATSFTNIGRSVNLLNDVTISQVGSYMTTSGEVTLKIARQNAPNNFDILFSYVFTHGGGGWQDFDIPSFTVPAAGTYNLGIHVIGNGVGTPGSAVLRSYASGNTAVANSVAMTADSSVNMPSVRYTHSRVFAANNLTVRSSSFSAPSAPTKMKALINVREIDAAVAGTDYFIDVSRDGGTTWSTMTLTERYSLPSGMRVVEGAEIDISGQPSGMAPRYRLRTANNKNVEFHDTYLYWS